jgi:hypothetical protein
MPREISFLMLAFKLLSFIHISFGCSLQIHFSLFRSLSCRSLPVVSSYSHIFIPYIYKCPMIPFAPAYFTPLNLSCFFFAHTNVLTDVLLYLIPSHYSFFNVDSFSLKKLYFAFCFLSSSMMRNTVKY